MVAMILPTPRMHLAVSITALSLIALAACNNGDDVADPSESGTSSDSTSEATNAAGAPTDDTDSANGVDRATASAVDPATMPAPGSIVLEVDGRRIEFRSADPGRLNFECSLASDRVGLDFQNQTNSHTVNVSAAILDGDWLGTGAANREDLDVRYSTTLDPSSVVLVEPPYLLVVSAFRSRPDDDPTASNDAGRGTITANCADDSAPTTGEGAAADEGDGSETDPGDATAADADVRTNTEPAEEPTDETTDG
jgi:hypothetical protein